LSPGRLGIDRADFSSFSREIIRQGVSKDKPFA
jgi:hypothetical protein